MDPSQTLQYQSLMTKTLPRELSDLADTLRDLPDQARADILAEIETKVQSLRSSQLNDAQRAIVNQRLAEPRVYVGADDVTAPLRHFNPAL
jgi:hypothetical protein